MVVISAVRPARRSPRRVTVRAERVTGRSGIAGLRVWDGVDGAAGRCARADPGPPVGSAEPAVDGVTDVRIVAWESPRFRPAPGGCGAGGCAGRRARSEGVPTSGLSDRRIGSPNRRAGCGLTGWVGHRAATRHVLLVSWPHRRGAVQTVLSPRPASAWRLRGLLGAGEMPAKQHRVQGHGTAAVTEPESEWCLQPAAEHVLPGTPQVVAPDQLSPRRPHQPPVPSDLAGLRFEVGPQRRTHKLHPVWDFRLGPKGLAYSPGKMGKI